MTVALVVRTFTHIVFAVDSRITLEGAIVSDDAKKYVRTRKQVAVFAGDWADCQAAMSALKTPDKPIKAKNWESLAYDRAIDRLSSISGDGCADPVKQFECIGSGADAAWGFLAAALTPAVLRDTLQVKHVARAALRAACKRHSSCGGRLRVLVIPRKTTTRVGR